MIDADVIVYLHPDGRDYVANFTEDGWTRWPAVQDGWTQRTGCPATLVDSCVELSPELGWLALRLSGVTS